VVVKLSANKRRTGRTRKKAPRHSAGELQDSGAEEKASEHEVGGPVESETDRRKAQSELESYEPKPTLAAEFQQARAEPAEPAKPEQSQQIAVEQPEAGQKSGGKRVAENKEGIFESFTKINESVFTLEGVKKAAAWYIETSEKFANQALELQERATGWAKDTPFAPLFEAQNSFARKFVERSANAARTLWQIQPTQ
jgi:hypothetical protein